MAATLRLRAPRWLPVWLLCKVEAGRVFEGASRGSGLFYMWMLWRERRALVMRRILYLACAYVLFVYMPTFAVRQLRLPFSQALIATALASAIVSRAVLSLPRSRIDAAANRYSSPGPSAFAVLTYPAFVLITTEPSLYKLAAVQKWFALGMSHRTPGRPSRSTPSCFRRLYAPPRYRWCTA